MDGRNGRIELLARATRGKAATPLFLADLSEALGEPVIATDLISLLETDVMLSAFRLGYHGSIQHKAVSYRRYFHAGERSLLFCFADCLAEKLLQESGFLLTKRGRDCGAVHVSVSVPLRHAASTIRFDGDSVSILSEDKTQGILIDQNPGDLEQTYEVVIWGEHWQSSALACV